jgi:[acyl-carrier-protein] S-malonyltransferase
MKAPEQLQNCFVFPGQGAQSVGMGRSLYEAYSEARDIFQQADLTLGYPLSRICFEGPKEELDKTIHSQLALLVSSMASLAVLKKIKPEISADLFGGLSLGEYSAQVAAGVLSFEQALKIVQKRAQLMQNACECPPAIGRFGSAERTSLGGMVSIIGLSLETVESLLQEIPGYLTIANLNCPGQIVVSGDKNFLDTLCIQAKAAGAKLTVILKVAGAFHSKYMAEASEQFQTFIQDFEIRKEALFQVLSNVTGKQFSQEDSWYALMPKQIVSPVRWEDNIRCALNQGIAHFYELGTGKTLGGMLKRIDKNISYMNLDTAEQIKEL